MCNLLFTGSPNCSFTEKLADSLLALPKAMYCNREVKIIKKGGDMEIICKKINSCMETFFLNQSNFHYFLGLITFFPLAIVTSPLLFGGSFLKDYILVFDSKANTYNKIAILAENRFDLLERKRKLSEIQFKQAREAESIPLTEKNEADQDYTAIPMEDFPSPSLEMQLNDSNNSHQKNSNIYAQLKQQKNLANISICEAEIEECEIEIENQKRIYLSGQAF